jgi:hypothetical protein
LEIARFAACVSAAPGILRLRDPPPRAQGLEKIAAGDFFQ